MRGTRLARSTGRRLTLGALAAILALPLGGCAEAERLARAVPRVLAPGGGPRVELGVPPDRPPAPPELPPAQPGAAFDWEPARVDAEGRSVWRVTIRAGGSPAMVALAKLTPLFSADGKAGPAYVADAYFRANPGRTPASIQPGDQFMLALPPGTFVVRWQEDGTEDLGHPARFRDYVSERGDRLRFYLTDPFPLLYELRPADRPAVSEIRFHPDLAFLLGTGRTDPIRLARLVYRMPDPDIFQVQGMRALGAELRPGEARQIELDRSRTYLDPVREALTRAVALERPDEPEHVHLRRGIFGPDADTPYLAVEDALGGLTDVSQLEAGRVFRVEYGRNGVVRVSYITGPDDARGKRDPYAHRENERWAALYERLNPRADNPVKWGPGEPSDLEPFPSARDTSQRRSESRHAYDYLVPGRVLVLTFRPIRSQSDARAQADLRELLGDLRDRYGEELKGLLGALDSAPRSGAQGR